MGDIQDKVKLGLHTKSGFHTPKHRGGVFENVPDSSIYKTNQQQVLRDGEFEDYNSEALAILGDTDNYFEEHRILNPYWNISPSADGTTGSPTIILDYRWNGKCLFIDISTYAVTIQLPNPTEVSLGFNIKCILSEASEAEATKNFGIITHDTGTDIQGYIGGGAAMNVTANTSSVYWDTSDAAASGGDWCEVITDGTGWYIKGQAALANSIDIADGHDVTT